MNRRDFMQRRGAPERKRERGRCCAERKAGKFGRGRSLRLIRARSGGESIYRYHALAGGGGGW